MGARPLEPDEEHFDIEVTIRKDGVIIAADSTWARRLDATSYDAVGRVARNVVTQAKKSLGHFERSIYTGERSGERGA